jgi:hypothetical protein
VAPEQRRHTGHRVGSPGGYRVQAALQGKVHLAIKSAS